MRRALRRRRQPHADECSFASCDLNMLSAFHNYNEARTFCTTMGLGSNTWLFRY